MWKGRKIERYIKARLVIMLKYKSTFYSYLSCQRSCTVIVGIVNIKCLKSGGIPGKHENE